jgi:hypothetical protein
MHKWLEKKTDELLDQAKEMSPKNNFEINLSSVAVINKALETPCEKNCPFPQRTPNTQ